MKTIIAGGRDGHLNPKNMQVLDCLGITEVVSGGCSGIDRDAEAWALSRHIPCKIFEAEWKKYKSAAGPLRNIKMAEYADTVVLFPGGKGTDSMYREAVKAKLEIYDFRDYTNRF